MSVIDLLNEYAKSRPRRNYDTGMMVVVVNDAPETDIERHLQVIYANIETNKKTKHSSYSRIPRFYYKKGSDVDQLQAAVQREGQARFLRRKGLSLPDRSDLDRLWWCCQNHRSPPVDDEHSRIDYEGFLAVREECEGKLAGFFQPTFFLSFPRDEQGRIDVQTFMNFVNSREGEGFLTEPELENYVLEVVPSFFALRALKESFMPFYLCTASRKFFFFLDKSRKGKISIKSLVTSPFLSEFHELQDAGILNDPDALKRNWFSRENAITIYNLDRDQNGMLSRTELAFFRNRALTKVVIDRVFEEIFTYDGEMDYKAYLDFLLSMEFRATFPAQSYLFKLLDIKGVGYITQWEINYFFKEISDRLDDMGMYHVNAEDVIGEIFDMVHPVDPYKITLDDLSKCGVGEVVISILIDVYAFIQYDSRETSPAGPEAV